MCGIVGYTGRQDVGIKTTVAGLKTLEYRGYDSAGVAWLGGDGAIKIERTVGRVDNLEKALQNSKNEARIAIGHTRWATHGAPSIRNAHPHCNAAGTIAVVHNGIIENYQELKEELIKHGYKFASETDTEVVPQLIDFYLKSSKTFAEAFEKALRQLRGAYGLLVMTVDDPETLYAARLGSPLVFGVLEDGYVVASDPAALIEHTKKVVFLKDYEVVRLPRSGNYDIRNLQKDMAKILREPETLDYDVTEISLAGYTHYMLKEIHEVPETIRAATRGRLKAEQSIVKLDGLSQVESQLAAIERIIIVACGTASYAGMLGEYAIEELAGIPVEVQLGSEFKYRVEPLSRSTALIVVSQSGETADTIAAIEKVKSYGVLTFGVVNAVGSTIARLTDAGVYCHAGPEQAVASTKAFVAQYTVLLMMALYLSNGHTDQYQAIMNELERLPSKAEEVLALEPQICQLAKKYASAQDFLFIGRGYQYPTALEGALKLKEVSYVHAEAYAAGEMKHGPLALIDKNFPTFALVPDGLLLEKTYSNIEEIKARSGRVLAVATKGNKIIEKLADDVVYIPKTLEQTAPLLTTIVTQLFAYYIALERGLDVDKPRNLAKSVTVE